MKFMLFLAVTFFAVQCNSPESSSTSTTTTPATNKAVEPTNKETYPVEEYVANHPELENYAVATFAGGCFWCTEAVFHRIKGVQDVISGYSGGDKNEQPRYGLKMRGGPNQLGPAEAIQVWYDPEVIDFKTLLDVFFVAHDPTQLNRQGPDQGPEYRSEVWYRNAAERAAIDAKISAINESGKHGGPVVTLVSAYDHFWVAEGYHQDYFERPPYSNPGYVERVTKPKLEKALQAFPELVKEEYQ